VAVWAPAAPADGTQLTATARTANATPTAAFVLRGLGERAGAKASLEGTVAAHLVADDSGYGWRVVGAGTVDHARTLAFRVKVAWRHRREADRIAEIVGALGSEIDLSPARALEIVDAWGNFDFASKPAYLQRVSVAASAESGPFLECGAGLSTVILGAAAKRRGTTVVSLEHDSFWARHMRRVLRRHALDECVTVVHAALQSYGEFDWYRLPEDLETDFGLVICDGPPGETRGGRFGLIEIMQPKLRPGALIVLDDTTRPAERAIAERWASITDASLTYGADSSYAELRLPQDAAKPS
jgi:predicted O-methyltransferase YrrM